MKLTIVQKIYLPPWDENVECKMTEAHKCLSCSLQVCLAAITVGNNSSWRKYIISYFISTDRCV